MNGPIMILIVPVAIWGLVALVLFFGSWALGLWLLGAALCLAFGPTNNFKAWITQKHRWSKTMRKRER